MAKKINNDEINVILNVNTSKAQAELKDMKNELGKLRQESNRYADAMAVMKANGKQNTEGYRNLREQQRRCSEQIRDLTARIKDHTSQLSINDYTMSQLRKHSKELKRQLEQTSMSLQPDEYKELAERLQAVNSRMKELEHSSKSLMDGLEESNVKSFMAGTAVIGLFNLAKSNLDSFVGRMKESVSVSIEMAENADGVSRAFSELDNAGLLDTLRAATKGTVNDFELMKAAVKAKDFRIPMEDLGKYLQFAQLKAQQTGESVEYMTESIVTGLGRKSPLILDNLGISAAEIAEKTKETGDFMKAVATIVETQLKQAGDTYVSAADRALKKTTDLQNAQLELGQVLLPYKQEIEDTFGGLELKLTSCIAAVLKHRDAVKAGAAALAVFIAASALSNRQLLEMVRTSKLATKAVTLFNVAVKTNWIAVAATAVAALATYLYSLFGASEKAAAGVKKLSESQKELQKTEQEARAELAKDMAALSQFSGSKEQEIELVKRMNQKYGESLGYYRSVSQWYEALKANSERYCRQMVIEAQMRQLASEAAEAEQNARNILYDENGNRRKYSSTREKKKVQRKKSVNAYTMNNTVEYEYLEQPSQLEEAQRRYNDEKRKSASIQQQMNRLVREQLTIEQQMRNGEKSDPYANVTDTTATDGKKAPELDESLDRERKQSLAEWNAYYMERKQQAEEAYMAQRISKQEHDAAIQQIEMENANTLLSMETDYCNRARQIMGGSDQQREKMVERYEQNLLRVQEQAQQTRNQSLQMYYEQMEAITSSGEENRTETLQRQRDMEMQALEAYRKAALIYAKQSHQSESDVDEAYLRARMAITKRYADKELEQAREDEKRKSAAREQLGIDVASEYDYRLQQLKAALDMQYITQEEYERKCSEMRRQKWNEDFQQYNQVFGNAVSALISAEVANVNAKYDAQIQAARNAGEDTTELENKAADEKLKIQKKYADVNFAITASKIIADTASSIMRAYADMGPVAGSVFAALLGVTGAAQLAAANAERERVKSLTLNGESSAVSATASRVVTGKEEGGRIDVRRSQDGKLFRAWYDPRKRGYIDRPTVIVGEGEEGKSLEWVASNDAIRNPTIAPVIDAIDRAQRAGTVRSLDLSRELMAGTLTVQGRETGGYAGRTQPAAGKQETALPPVSYPSLSDDNARRLSESIELLTERGVKAIVGLDELDATRKLRDRLRYVARKNP